MMMNKRPVSDYTPTTCNRVGCNCQRLLTVKKGDEDNAMCDGGKPKERKNTKWTDIIHIVNCLVLAGIFFGIGFAFTVKLILI